MLIKLSHYLVVRDTSKKANDNLPSSSHGCSKIIGYSPLDGSYSEGVSTPSAIFGVGFPGFRRTLQIFV